MMLRNIMQRSFSLREADKFKHTVYQKLQTPLAA